MTRRRTAAAWLWAAFAGIAGLWTALAIRLIPPKYQVMSLLSGYPKAFAIWAVINLRIPDHLREGPLTAAVLAVRLGVQPEPLFRLMRAASSLGCFRERQGRFELAPMGRVLCSGVDGSVQMPAAYLGREPLQAWHRLADTVRDGQPAIEAVLGEPYFDHLARNEQSANYFRSMLAFGAELFDGAIVNVLELNGAARVIDIGGGAGHLLCAMLARHPALHGTLFESAAVVERAARLAQQRGVAERCRIVAGDLFEGPIPAHGDVYLMKCVLHDFDDARAVQILRRVRAAMGDASRLAICEIVLTPSGDSWMNYYTDLTMMLMHGGKERTEEEFAALCEAAGLAIERVTRTPFISVIEVLPRA